VVWQPALGKSFRGNTRKDHCQQVKGPVAEEMVNRLIIKLCIQKTDKTKPAQPKESSVN